MTFNQGNPYTRPARQMYVPLDTEDRILVERHYIPATVYRDLYNIPRYVPPSINNPYHQQQHQQQTQYFDPAHIFDNNINSFFSNPIFTSTPINTPTSKASNTLNTRILRQILR